MSSSISCTFGITLSHFLPKLYNPVYSRQLVFQQAHEKGGPKAVWTDFLKTGLAARKQQWTAMIFLCYFPSLKDIIIPNIFHDRRRWVESYQLKNENEGHEEKCHRKKAGTRFSESLAWGQLCVLEFFVATAPEGATDWPKTTKEWRTLAQGGNAPGNVKIQIEVFTFVVTYILTLIMLKGRYNNGLIALTDALMKLAHWRP